MGKKFWGALAVLLLAFNLMVSACGTVQGTVTSTPVGAVALPSVQITTNSATTAANTTFAPIGVPTDNIQLTAAITKSEATSVATADSISVAATNQNTTTAPITTNNISATQTVAPTPTPTLEGVTVKVDKAYELKLIKTAYDAILQHLFKQPNTALLLSATITTVVSITNQPSPTLTFGKDDNDNWNKFSTAFNTLVDNANANGFTYPKGQLAHRAVQAMADAVNDEHTSFLNKDDYQQRNNLLSGDNTSIGFGILQTVINSNDLYIVRVIPGSPADKAGLKAGDQILQFDGEIANANTSKVVRATLQGTTHTFLVKRLGQSQPLTITATKGQYTSPTVEYRLVNNNIGYIAIRDFYTNVANETDKAMTDLYKQGARAWIIDVRQNPGGVNAEEVAGRFVKGDSVMGYDINRKEHNDDKVSNSGVNGSDNGKPFAPLLPMVLLADEGSGSSSEIFALAVRDFKLGPIVGEKTAGALGHTAAYGLGDDTAITVTVDEYVSVNQEKDNGIGVTPDITVPMTPEDYANNRDPQLVTAVNEVQKSLTKTAAGG